MTKARAQTLAAQALQDLDRALRAGHSQALTRYLAALARFPAYSASNVLLVLAQRPDASHVAGFRTWRRLGRWVRRGEKGIAILAPLRTRPRNDEKEDAVVAGFRTVHVFDITQTDGAPLPELASVRGDPAGLMERLHAFTQARGITLTYATDLGGAQGRSSGGHITLRHGLPPAEAFAVLAHELAHELLHHDAQPRPRRVRETEAEAVAYVVCTRAGLDSHASTTDYIHLHHGDADTLAASLTRIQEAANTIITGALRDGRNADVVEGKRRTAA